MKNKKTIFLIICLFLISVLIGLTIQYTINYNLSKTISLYNAGSYNVPATITVKKGSTYGDLPSLEKENYIFT